MNDARTLIKKYLDHPVLLDHIDDEDDLVAAGVDSGEIIRIALGCEEHLRRALSDTELAELTSVRAVSRLLSEKDTPCG